MSGTITRGNFPAWPGERAKLPDETALTLLNRAIDYGVTAIADLDGSHGGAAREDICEALIQLRALRDILSPNPAMERPIGDEFLQEWLR